ncbi:MAG: DUF2249 domain-containing protein [Verrucomicrobiota bacterium]|nr:DUF2249 domain-containing protein [Verrucomicrobiota bacterium]
MNIAPNTQSIPEDKIFRGTQIPCSIKHGLILGRARALKKGDFFVLENDHDPIPLGYQFKAENPGEFSWEYLERGPENYQVKITRIEDGAVQS